MKKYEILTDNYTVLENGTKVLRIKSLVDIPEYGVKKGDIGGYIEKESNLSHDGKCWIFDNAKAYGEAVIFENARVYDYSEVCGHTKVYGDSMICGRTFLSGYSLASESILNYNSSEDKEKLLEYKSGENKSLYKLKSSSFGYFFVVAEHPTEAQDKLLCFLDTKYAGITFSKRIDEILFVASGENEFIY